MMHNTTNHDEKWVRVVQFEGGSKTLMPPDFDRALCAHRTEGRKWRITYEEMTE